MNFLLIIAGMIVAVVSFVLFGFLIYWVQKTKKWVHLSIGVSIIVVLALGVRWWAKYEKPPSEVRVTAQIYPNYKFPEGVNQIQVPLIPLEQRLAPEAGGWVIVPLGSRIRIDYEVPVVIENIDGRKFYREPGKPVWDGVEPGNGIFRLYGKKGKYAVVTIKRGVY